jgi:adenosine deaminase
VRIIVDVSRSFGPKNAMKNLDLTLDFLKRNKTERILGIGLGGQEVGHPCADYAEVFEKARKSNLHVVAHAGEEVGPESVWEALDVLHAERIGHGISSIQDAKLMTRLKKDRTPLEICPTSNVYTKKYVKRIADHPIRTFFDKGLMVTVNTDDPILFSVELNEEFHKVATEIGFSRDEILQLVKNGIDSTFLSSRKRKSQWESVLKSVGKL